MQPLFPDLWETWHTGSRLISIDPLEVAKAIDTMYNSDKLREITIEKGLERVNQFKWANTQQAMVRKVEELYARSTG